MVGVFLTCREEFGIFTTYIKDYDRSMALLEESCRRSQTFADIVKRFEVRKCLWGPVCAFTGQSYQFKGCIGFIATTNTLNVNCIKLNDLSNPRAFKQQIGCAKIIVKLPTRGHTRLFCDDHWKKGNRHQQDLTSLFGWSYKCLVYELKWRVCS